MGRNDSIALPLFAGAILSACGGAAQPSPGSLFADPSAAASATVSPTASASASTTTASLSPAPYAPGSRVTVPGEGVGWDTVAAVVRGRDRYLALGYHYEPSPPIGYNGGQRLWTSDDGLAWERAAVPTEFEVGVLGRATSLVATPVGEFLLFGNGYSAENMVSPVVMRSADGLSWNSERVDLPSQLYLTRVVAGPKGYLLAGRDDGPGGLWHSGDGMAWHSVHALTQTDTTFEIITDIGAGEEGFVAMGISGSLNGGSQLFALASGDGSTWLRADDPIPATDGHAGVAIVAPVGGDWVIATTARSGSATQFWRSANGLQWEPAGVLEDAPPGNPVLVSAGGQLFYSPSAGDGPPALRPGGGWASADGHIWTEVDLGPDGLLAGAFHDDLGLLLVGSQVVSDDRADAAFWRP